MSFGGWHAKHTPIPIPAIYLSRAQCTRRDFPKRRAT